VVGNSDREADQDISFLEELCRKKIMIWSAECNTNPHMQAEECLLVEKQQWVGYQVAYQCEIDESCGFCR
jgi:hypothetical protein